MAGILAIGDATPGQALAHVASKEGINAAEFIGYNEKKLSHLPDAIDYGNIPGCTYCTPEIASVGYTEKAAKEAGYEVKVGKFPFIARCYPGHDHRCDQKADQRIRGSEFDNPGTFERHPIQ